MRTKAMRILFKTTQKLWESGYAITSPKSHTQQLKNCLLTTALTTQVTTTTSSSQVTSGSEHFLNVASKFQLLDGPCCN